MLVGEGAESFAREQGFISEPNENMLSDHTATAYQVCPLTLVKAVAYSTFSPNTRKNIIYNL